MYWERTYSNLIPDVIITLEQRQVMLYGDDQTVALSQLVLESTRQVSTSAHGDDGGFGW